MSPSKSAFTPTFIHRVRPAAVALVLVLPLVLAGCASPSSDDTSTGATAVSSRTHDIDMYVSMAAQMHPLEGKTLGAAAFSLSPDGPFTVPGPEIRVREGDRVRVTLHSAAHTIHWHGVSLPWAMDGVPYMTQTISGPDEPGGVYVYEFDAHETGTYWYHCHVDAPVHVDAGMFGAFIVEPRDAKQDPPFSREYTLMLHEADSQGTAVVDLLGQDPEDRAGNVPPNPLDAADGIRHGARGAGDAAGHVIGDATTTSASSGQYAGSQGPRDYYPQNSVRYRPHYDVFMINGKSFPETEPLFIKSDETIRIRVINAGQLVHTMHLHGHHFLVTHKDGYNLPAPYWADTLLLGAGERYDVYVNGDNPGLWDLHDHSGGYDIGGFASNDHAFPGGMDTMLVYEDFTEVELPGPEARTSGAYVAFAPSFASSLDAR